MPPLDVRGKWLTATLIFLPMLALLIGLGVWQIQRLHWKEALLAEIESGLATPAVELANPPPPEFHHVFVTGTLVAGKPLFIYGRTQDGDAGVHVMALLVRRDAPLLLVDRGFLPFPIDQAKATAPLTGGEVDGIIRLATGQHWFDPANNPAENQWYWIDPPAMAAALDVAAVQPFYIEAMAPTAVNGPAPAGGLILGNIRNQHLQYAIFWFTMAGILVVIYGLSVRDNTVRQRDA